MPRYVLTCTWVMRGRVAVDAVDAHDALLHVLNPAEDLPDQSTYVPNSLGVQNVIEVPEEDLDADDEDEA